MMTILEPKKKAASQFAQVADGWIRTEAKLPRYGQYVLYRTAEYQALGCFDRPGIWRFSDGEHENNPVKAWQAIN